MTVPLLAKQGILEAIATFILVFVGAGAIIANTQTGGASGLIGIAFAHGLAIFVGVAATGHISGTSGHGGNRIRILERRTAPSRRRRCSLKQQPHEADSPSCGRPSVSSKCPENDACCFGVFLSFFCLIYCVKLMLTSELITACVI